MRPNRHRTVPSPAWGRRTRWLALLGVVLLGWSSLLAVTAPSAQAAPSDYRVTATISVPRSALGLAVNPSTGRLYVTDGNESVFVIDVSTNAVIATIALGAGSSPTAIAVDSSTNRIYVPTQIPFAPGSEDPGNVTVIDGATNAVVDTIPVGIYPNEVAVNPTTQMLYVTNGDNSVSVIDLTTRVVSSFTVASGPHGVVVNPNTNVVYVVSGVIPTNLVSVIDGSDNSVTATIDVGQDNPWTPAINLTTGTVYVPHSGGHTDKVSVIDGTTVTATIAVGSESSSPSALAVDSASATVYVASDWDNSLYVIDGDTNTVVATVAVGTSPWAVAVNPSTHTVYVGDANSGVVRVINQMVAQTIAFTSAPPANAVVGASHTVTATGGGSGLPVVFSSGSTSSCTVTAAGVVTFVGLGPCVIDANQATFEQYLAAPQLSQPIQVQPAPATATELTADGYYVTAGQQVRLSATVTSPGIGTPTGSVSFTDGGTTVGTGPVDGSGTATVPVTLLVAGARSIVASYGGDGTFGGSDSAPVTVTVFPAAVDHLVISPPSATIAAGADQRYTAATYDEFDNLISEVTDDTVFTVDDGASCVAVTCTSTVAGEYSVTGAYEVPPVLSFAGFALAAVPPQGSVAATATLRVTPAALDHLVVSPPTATVVVGSGQEYSAAAYDEFANLIGDVTTSTAFTVDGDAGCAAATCTPAAVGAYTVTGTYGAVADTAVLTAIAAVGVAPSDGGDTAPLATTGAHLAGYAQLAGILLILGVGLLAVVRRRVRP